MKLLNIFKNVALKYIFVKCQPQVRRHMYRAGLFRTLGRKHLWRKFSTALEKCEADLAKKNKHK